MIDPIRTRSFLASRSLLLTFVTLGAAFALGGCSGGTTSDEETSTGSVSQAGAEKAKDDAEVARENADKQEARKYASGEYQDGVERFEKGELLLASGDKKATTQFRQARDNFRKATEAAKTNKAIYGEAENAKKKYEDMKKQAEQVKVAERAPDIWKKAEGYYAEGNEFLKDSAKLKLAKRKFSSATSELEVAISSGRDKETQKKLAEEAVVDMDTKKQLAAEANASNLAMSEYAQAEDAEKEGRQHLAAANYDLALRSLRTAKDMYIYAYEIARTTTETARAPQPERDPTGLGSGDSEDHVRTPAPDVEKIKPIYKGGDEIHNKLGLLFKVPYEYSNGVIKLDCTNGPDFKKSAYWTPYTKTEGREINLRFEGSDGIGYVDTSKEDEKEDEEEVVMSYTFAGNTKGQLMYDCQFKDGVKVEFDVWYQRILADDPIFQVVLNSDGKDNFYGITFGAVLEIAKHNEVSKVVRAPNKEFQRPFQLWVDRKKKQHYKMVYKKGEDGKGTLRVELNGEETFNVPVIAHDVGKVGWRWNNVKFIVFNTSISGRLDEEWAKERIAEQESKPQKEEKPPDEDF